MTLYASDSNRLAEHSKRGMEKLSTEFRRILTWTTYAAVYFTKFAITAHRFSLSYAVPQPDNNIRNKYRRFFTLCDL
jgi:hypothetical protein